MILIALDASTNKTGVSIWKDGVLATSLLLDFSYISDTDERLEHMCNSIWDTLNNYKPTDVYIEDTYCGGNPKVQRLLDRIQGVTYAWCMRKNVRFNTITPSRWRKYIDGFPNGKGVKRSELKNFSVNYVTNKYKIECNDDVADAILIGEAAIQLEGGNGNV